MRGRFNGVAPVAALVAASLGLASAAVSAYWAMGGTGLLDTLGGEVERRGREHSLGVVVTLWLIVVLKLVGAAAPLVFAGAAVHQPPSWVRSRRTRVPGWMVAVGLMLYGTV